MEVTMGSNVIRNTNGIFKIEGKDQIYLELDQNSQLLLTMDVYDTKGIQVAKLIRNLFSFDHKDRYRLIAKPSALMLIDREHNTVLFEVSVTDFDNHRVQVLQGNFYSHKAHPVEITPRCWRVLGTTTAGTTFDCHGDAIIIGK